MRGNIQKTTRGGVNTLTLGKTTKIADNTGRIIFTETEMIGCHEHYWLDISYKNEMNLANNYIGDDGKIYFNYRILNSATGVNSDRRITQYFFWNGGGLDGRAIGTLVSSTSLDEASFWSE